MRSGAKNSAPAALTRDRRGGDQRHRDAAEFDPQPFHLDDRAARETIFRGLAASGWHTAAATMRLLVESEVAPSCRNSSDNRIVRPPAAVNEESRWPHPVPPGDSARSAASPRGAGRAAIEVALGIEGLVKLRTTTL